MKEKILIIVESPTKIKTLKKFLGDSFVFESSIGHIRDLPKSDFGIDVENDFQPKYQLLSDKKKVVDRLKKAANKVDTIYLSPDPDREGEAIAWHIASILPKKANIKRVAFNSITKNAVMEALRHPKDINMALVNAQQARRLLDRIVGYKISPILARRIRRKGVKSISAGRVQSVALKLVVDREKAINAFKPVEFWNIVAWLQVNIDKTVFQSQLYSVDGKKIEKEPSSKKNTMVISNKETADRITYRLEHATFRVGTVDRKEKQRSPVPPFITSTLQQEANRYYGFSSAKTMSIAQSLYEGVDMDNEATEGLITYMRTDSVRVEPEAIEAARNYIVKTFGASFLPGSPRVFSSKKSAQDAHEAIRPTNLEHSPDSIRSFLSNDQYRLYLLIWRRFVSTQMKPAVYDTVTATILTNDNIVLKVNGSTIKFQGFLALYEEKSDDDTKDDENRLLPDLKEGQELEKVKISSDQSFTKPPPRYTEASLVKELEKSGIGRPSTYATIMNKIQSREYTFKEGKSLHPTELGQVVAAMLETNFKQIMNIGFTASMEDDLEMIASNDKDWVVLIKEFWKDFIPTVEMAEKEAFVPKIVTDIICPKCKSQLQKIWTGAKYFYGCSNYPDCDYTTSIAELSFKKEDYAEGFNWDQLCPICSKSMQVRHGRFGPFLGCSVYPDCRGIISIPKRGESVINQEDLPLCPALECDGKICSRKSRFGKIFFSCSNFPECNVIANNLDELNTKYTDHIKTPYVKKTKKTKSKKVKKPRNLPAQNLTPELASIVGSDKLSRNQVMKQVWVYIKAKNLQSSDNKRIIVPDDALAKVLGSNDPIDMFKMTGIISKHMKK